MTKGVERGAISALLSRPASRTHRTMPHRPLAAAFALLLTLPLAAQDSWPQFRGPGGLSLGSGTPPAAFGPGESQLWRQDLPPGSSSPCIQGELVVVTGYEEGLDVVLAFDRSSGELAWRREFEGDEHPQYMHADAAPAVPTPCADADRFYCYLGSYGLVALDREGKTAWERRMPHPGYAFGIGNSPILCDGAVVVFRDGAPEAAVLALEAEDGSERWTIDRFSFGESHGTPFVWRNSERTELVIGGTARLQSFDPATGKQLWSYTGTTVFPCTSAVADEEVLFFAAWSSPNADMRTLWEVGFGRSLELTEAEMADPALIFERFDRNNDGKILPEELPECRVKDAFVYLDQNKDGHWDRDELLTPLPPAPGKNLMIAVPAGVEGQVSDEDLLWKYTRQLPYVASPLLYEGRIWLVKAGGILSCLDARSGEPIIRPQRLPDRSEYYMSPIGVDGRILLGSAEGSLFQLDAQADELEILHETSFEDGLFATPAVVDGKVWLRSTRALWCFGD